MSSYDLIIRKSISQELTGNEVMKLFGEDVEFLLYEKLVAYESIPELLKGKRAIILLYQYTKYEGHYCLLSKCDNNTVEWFDPLGYKADEELKFLPYDKEPYLSNLLRRFINAGGNVIQNNYKFERNADRVATCGRHVIARLSMKDLDLEHYIDFFKTSKIDNDKLVTLMTLIIRH
jgi:hypothetical protein